MVNSLNTTLNLIKRKRPDFEFKVFHSTPVTHLSRPLKESKLALITTGGLHLKTDIPFDLNLKEGDCSYRLLPGDVKKEDLCISHKWYNHKFIKADINCVFPVDRMREYVMNGKIKSLSEEHYSFMGHIYVTEPLFENSREVGKHLKKLGVDIAFITPT